VFRNLKTNIIINYFKFILINATFLVKKIVGSGIRAYAIISWVEDKRTSTSVQEVGPAKLAGEPFFQSY
jgi:hypothetical protein